MSENPNPNQEQENEAAQAQQQEQQQPAPVNPFAQESWADAPPVSSTDEHEKQGAAASGDESEKSHPPSPPVNQGDEDEILDPKDYLKREFGWEDPELGKKELEELRALKNKPPVEFKFENEESERAFNLLKEGKVEDLYEILDTKRKIAATENMSAIDVLKLQIELQNKHYTKEDIQDIIEERYSFPEKPIKDEDESDTDFQARVDKWQAKVDKVTRRTERDAIEAKQQLAKLNSELKLPDIPKAAPAPSQPSQESLEAIAKAREGYLQKLESDYNSFDGFNTKVKDESVELPVSFKVPDEEKVALKARLQDFDPNDYLEQRLFAGGVPDIKRTMADIYVLENIDKILAGVATNATNQRLAQFIKEKTNTDVAGAQTTLAPRHGQAVNPISDKSWVKQN